MPSGSVGPFDKDEDLTGSGTRELTWQYLVSLPLLAAFPLQMWTNLSYSCNVEKQNFSNAVTPWNKKGN